VSLLDNLAAALAHVAVIAAVCGYVGREVTR
jgi:hypothetical protein